MKNANAASVGIDNRFDWLMFIRKVLAYQRRLLDSFVSYMWSFGVQILTAVRVIALLVGFLTCIDEVPVSALKTHESMVGYGLLIVGFGFAVWILEKKIKGDYK